MQFKKDRTIVLFFLDFNPCEFAKNIDELNYVTNLLKIYGIRPFRSFMIILCLFFYLIIPKKENVFQVEIKKD